MKRMFALVLALVMVISMMPLSFVSAQTTTSDRVKDMVENMTLRDKVTQMMMVDFRNWDEDLTDDVGAVGFTTMNDQVRKIVEDYNFGALIYFAPNVVETEQTYNLTMEMQKAATKDGGIAMLISADQEGGNVYRLGTGTALPGNMALGATYATHGTKYALEAGRIIGSELAALGINTNLAPVVDVNNNPNNPVIGLRSYGDDATIVGELASASIAGMAEYNVVGCAKHFPGHGDTATDSHYGLPMVDKSLEVLLEYELKPYEVAIEQGIEMIMTAHILYPQLEGDKILSNKTGEYESLPATMSDDILTDLLKGEMGFEGIIVTDAMNMAGIADKWDQVQSVVVAIAAGVDMICMPCVLYDVEDLADLDAIIEGVIMAVADGTIPMSRIDDAVTRILTVKENRGLLDWDESDYSLDTAMEVVGGTKNRDMEREIAAAAVTVVKNENHTLPLELTENSKVLMLVPYNNEVSQMLMAWNRAKEAGIIPEGAEVDYYRFSNSTINDALKAKLDWADTYIINSEVSSVARMEYKHWLSAMPNKLCDYAAENGKTAIISSVDKPYDVQMYPNADAIVAAYGCKGSSVDPTEALLGGATGSAAAYGPNIIAAVEVILGTFNATGKLPVTVPVYDKASNAYTDEIAYERGHGIEYRIKAIMDEMSLREKITQMLMVDFRYWDEDLTDNVGQVGFTEMNDQIQRIVEDYKFGAIIYFAQNVVETEQTFNLTMDLQKAATAKGGLPMIITADQEGGIVFRLGSGTALPGNMALGATYATHGTKYALEAGRIIGSELAALGINTNLAPVVDVNNNPNNPVIGLRSYSDDATIVGELASASIAGMAEYNVVGTAKHFPGHGDTATDSHYGLPVVDKSLDVLKEVELKPYEVAIDQGIEMIMTAHILYPQLEDDKILSNKTGEYESLPATMSDDILTGLLKGEMGFEGIVVTDAMNMAGIADKWDQVQSVVVAIAAGVDMICMPCVLYNEEDLADLDAIIDGVIMAMAEGQISIDRVNDAVKRILTVKENRGILDWSEDNYSIDKAEEVVGGTANRAMEREIAAAAVTVVKNENNTLPLKLTENSKVLMLVPYNNERVQMAMAWNRAKEACLIPAGAEVKIVRFASADMSAIQADLEWADTYIINSEISSTARMEYKHWLSALPNAVCDYAAENGKTAIITSVDKPYDVQMYPNADAIVAGYGCKGVNGDPTEALVGGVTGVTEAIGPNIIANVEVVLGTFGATGKLPIAVPVYDKAANTYTDEVAYERGYGLTYEGYEHREHTYGDWFITTEPTCTEQGEETQACTHCGMTQTRPVDPKGHDHVAEVVAPTCTEDGYTVYTCHCGDVYYKDPVPALGHSFGEWVVVDATCTEDGLKTRTCATCGEVETEAIPATGHNFESVVTAPTCTEAGYTTYTCANCGHSYVGDEVPATGHSFGEWTVTKAPTCTEAGEQQRVCATCGEVETEVIPALGHQHTAEVVEPTCTTNGYTVYTCTVCGDVYYTDYIVAFGHSFGEWIVAKAPTCTEDGMEKRVCATCGEVETRALKAHCGSSVYEDVPANAWFHDAVDYMTDNGYMNGMDTTHFGPDVKTTRAMMAQLLYRMAGEPSVEGLKSPFVDVTAEQWYHDAIVWAASEGIVNGMTPNSFAPNDNITRAQMVAMLHRYADAPAGDVKVLEGYSDVKTLPTYAQNAFAWAVESGIVNGVDADTLGHDALSTRAQIAVMLTRYLTK